MFIHNVYYTLYTESKNSYYYILYVTVYFVHHFDIDILGKSVYYIHYL